jgi:hypothetical protein
VTTIAGSGSGTFADGTGSAASFYHPTGVAFSADGSTIAVADTYYHRVRLINVATGAVTTIAGSGSGAFADGTGSAASFNQPTGVAYSSDGSTIAVADYSNHRVREICTGITPSPTAAPTTTPTAYFCRQKQPPNSTAGCQLLVTAVDCAVSSECEWYTHSPTSAPTTSPTNAPTSCIDQHGMGGVDSSLLAGPCCGTNLTCGAQGSDANELAKAQSYCHGFSSSHWMIDDNSVCCGAFEGCREARSLTQAMEKVKTWVTYDIGVSICGFTAFVIASLASRHLMDSAIGDPIPAAELSSWLESEDPADKEKLAKELKRQAENTEEPRWLKLWGNLFLAALSAADGAIAIRILTFLQEQKTVASLQTLFFYSCFSRVSDKVVYDTSAELEAYEETTVMVQVCAAIAGMVWHITKAMSRENSGVVSMENITGGRLGFLISLALEATELIVTVVGFISFGDVYNDFMGMYQVAGAADATAATAASASSASACVYSCCK